MKSWSQTCLGWSGESVGKESMEPSDGGFPSRNSATKEEKDPDGAGGGTGGRRRKGSAQGEAESKGVEKVQSPRSNWSTSLV